MRGLLISVALATALAPGAGAADMAAVRERGSLRALAVETMAEFFTFQKDAEPGFDRELLQGFARLHKIELEAVEVPSWDRLIPMLRAGKGDLIAGLVTVTDQRKQIIDFTSEVFPSRTVVLTRKPIGPIRTLEELRKLKVGTAKGTSVAAAVASLGIPPQNVDDSLVPGQLPNGITRGRVEAVVVGLEEAILARREDPGFQVGLFVGEAESLAYGVRKEDPELLRALDEFVRNFRRSGVWNRLVVKYLGEAAPEILKRARR